MVVDREVDENIIYKKYNSKIFGLFFSKTNNYDLSRDLTAETITKVILNYKSKKYNKLTLDNYVFNTANNNFVDYLRKINRKKRIPQNLFTSINTPEEYQYLDEEINVKPKNIKPFEQNTDCNYMMNYNISEMFNSVKDNMMHCENISLKKYFEFKYLKHLSDKQIKQKMKINDSEIEKIDTELLNFLKKQNLQELFT